MSLFQCGFPYLISSFLFLGFFALSIEAAPERFGCDILDAECREQISRNGFVNEQRQRTQGTRCNYQDLWLIPGRADASCSEFLNRNF